MKMNFVGFRVLLVWSAAAPILAQNGNWPSFRGENGRGVAEGSSLPVKWDASTGVRWRTAIPGLGNSSPILWGNRLYISTAISSQDKGLKPGLYGDIAPVQDSSVHRYVVYCLDASTGRIVWEKTVFTGVPKVKRHPKATHANSTLATDGKHLIAFFGSEGLFCLDMNGKEIWKKDLGVLQAAFYVAPAAQWEFGSSPIIYRETVLIQVDVLNGSYVAALNVRDGSELWRTSRSDVPTWGTPSVYSDGGTAQVIVNGYSHAGGYDIRDGKEIWWLKGGGDIPVPTPVISGDMAFLTSAHGPTAPVYAIRLNARGDISLKENETSNKSVAWSYPRDGSYMATPVVYRDYVYNCRWNGVLCCYESKTGTRAYQERLGSGMSAFTASPVAGDGKIFLLSEDGDVYVVRAGPKFELLAVNNLGEVCMASPAVSKGILYFRTQSNVLAIGK